MKGRSLAKPKGWAPKHCIFCGKKPGAKTKEHFVPRWMSIASGADDIAAYIPMAGQDKKIKFSGVTMPACDVCNHSMSGLEGQAKTAFENIRSGVISHTDAHVLLKWMDKFRISLWLFQLATNKEEHSIQPRFTVNDRIEKSDHLISISLLPDSNSTGIGFVGSEPLVFRASPTVIGLLFRDVAIISWSEVLGLTDHFGLTKNATAPTVNGHPLINKEKTGRTPNWKDFDHINRIPSVELFSFSQEDKDICGDLPFGEVCRVAENQSLQVLNEHSKIKIPRCRQNKWAARSLWALSVLEMQKRSSAIFQYLDLPSDERHSFRWAQIELDNYIDLAVKDANSHGIAQYSRRVPKTY